jgi:hypothetical protein
MLDLEQEGLGEPQQRWYDKFKKSPQWRAVRNQVRSEEPMCSGCGQRPTSDVDHVIKATTYLRLQNCFDEDDQLRAFCDRGNLQGLCPHTPTPPAPSPGGHVGVKFQYINDLATGAQ